MNMAIATALLESGALRFQPQHPIVFKSGIVSPVYVDNRRLPAAPQQWHTIIEGLALLINSREIDFDLIAGVATAGIPHSAALGFHMQRPSIFVRKALKAHGAKQRVEGADVDKKSVVLVEDMVTTGGSSLEAVVALRDAGAVVEHCIAITSYGFANARFVDANVQLHALVQFDLLLKAAHTMGLVTNDDVSVINDWFAEPEHWAKRQGLR